MHFNLCRLKCFFYLYIRTGAESIMEQLTLRVLRANPAGNITLYVLDPVDPALRPKVTAHLLGMDRFKAEQLAYCCTPIMGGQGRIEMAGGEFCGNATRAFAMVMQQEMGVPSPSTMSLEVSGCDHLVTAFSDLAAGAAESEMPLPRSVRTVQVEGQTGVLVDLDGIVHLVVEGVAPSLDFFQKVEPLFQEFPGLEAYGVMFLDRVTSHITPLVKVPAANTLVWEGSCGSGSVASAIACAMGAPDGQYDQDLIQPAGVIHVKLTLDQGQVTQVGIGGPVSLDPAVSVQIPL